MEQHFNFWLNPRLPKWPTPNMEFMMEDIYISCMFCGKSKPITYFKQLHLCQVILSYVYSCDTLWVRALWSTCDAFEYFFVIRNDFWDKHDRFLKNKVYVRYVVFIWFEMNGCICYLPGSRRVFLWLMYKMWGLFEPSIERCGGIWYL